MQAAAASRSSLAAWDLKPASDMLFVVAGPKKRLRCGSPEYKRFDTTVKPSAIRTDRQKERRASQRKGEAIH